MSLFGRFHMVTLIMTCISIPPERRLPGSASYEPSD